MHEFRQFSFRIDDPAVIQRPRILESPKANFPNFRNYTSERVRKNAWFADPV